MFSFVALLYLLSGFAKANSFDTWSVAGKAAELPCPLQENYKHDRPLLVLWYRESITKPIYSYDARTGHFGDGIHWADNSILDHRAHFKPLSSPPVLYLTPVKYSDHGEYICRVDYSKSPTSSSTVNLTVVIPPQSPLIFWENRQMIGPVGPLKEGIPTQLTCKSAGGRPPPKVTWWKENVQLQGQVYVEETTPGGAPQMGSTVEIIPSRGLLGTSLSCQAVTSLEGTVTLLPKVTRVTLNITLPPLEITIQGIQESLSSGATARIVCRTRGSHPPAEVSWWIAGKLIKDVITAVHEGGNATSAELVLTATSEDNGASLTCRAANQLLSLSPISQTVSLNVFFKPQVELQLVKKEGTLLSDTFDEGQTVVFECRIKANPLAQKIQWYHNSDALNPNAKLGLIITGQQLELANLKRRHTGSYTCSASNSEGFTTSNSVQITVNYVPVCVEGWQKRIHGVPLGSTSSVTCRVDSLPAENVTYSWVRLLDDSSFIRFPQDKVEAEGLSSRIFLTVNTLDDFGTVLCEATNAVGTQREPCEVTLVPAGKPEPPINCSVEPSLKFTSLSVVCVEGFDGGFPQSFHLQVWQRQELIVNLTSEFPEWCLENLEPDEGATFKVFAQNAMGESQALRMEVHVPSAQLHSQADLPPAVDPRVELMAPILGAVGGTAAVVLFVLLVAVLVVKSKKRNDTKAGRESSTEERQAIYKGIPNPDVVASVQLRHHGHGSLDVVSSIGTTVQGNHITKSSFAPEDDPGIESGSEYDFVTDLTSVNHHRRFHAPQMLTNCAGYVPVAVSELCIPSGCHVPMNCVNRNTSCYRYASNSILLNGGTCVCPYNDREARGDSPIQLNRPEDRISPSIIEIHNISTPVASLADIRPPAKPPRVMAPLAQDEISEDFAKDERDLSFHKESTV